MPLLQRRPAGLWARGGRPYRIMAGGGVVGVTADLLTRGVHGTWGVLLACTGCVCVCVEMMGLHCDTCGMAAWCVLLGWHCNQQMN